MMHKSQPTHQTVFIFMYALFLLLGTACNSTSDKDPDKKTSSESHKKYQEEDDMITVETVPVDNKQQKEEARNSNAYQQQLKSLGSLKEFDYSSANDYKAIFDNARAYLNEKFHKKNYKKKRITKKALKSISGDLFEEGSIIKEATDQAIAGYILPSHFWKYKFWKENDRKSKNGAIVHFLISAIAVRYEAERLIKEGTLTEQEVKKLKEKLLSEEKETYEIQDKSGLGLRPIGHGPGTFKKPKELVKAVNMMKEALDKLLQEEKDITK